MREYLGKAGVVLALVLPCLLYSQETREYRDRYYVRERDGVIVCYDLISNRVYKASTGKGERLGLHYLPTPEGGAIFAEDMAGNRKVNIYRFNLPDLRLVRKIPIFSLFSNPDKALLPGGGASYIVMNSHACLLLSFHCDADRFDSWEYYEEVMDRGEQWVGIEVVHYIWDFVKGGDPRKISSREYKNLPRIPYRDDEKRRYGLARSSYWRSQNPVEQNKEEKLKRKIRELRARYNIPKTHDYFPRGWSSSVVIIEEPVPAE